MRRHDITPAALFALLAVGAAGAQDGGDAAPGAELEPIVVVASRHPGEAWDVAGSVSVLSAEAAQDILAQDLRDSVRYLPGVSFDGGGTRFGAGGFRIRGLGGNRVLTLVDGIPVAERFSVGSYGDSGRDYTDLGLIRQIEILRGPASSLYGSKALGGVVALETVDPADVLDAAASGGWANAGYSGDRNRGSLAAASAWGGADASALLAATWRQGHELESEDARQRDPQDWQRQTVLAKSVFDTSVGTLRVLADYARESRQTDLKAILGTGRFVNTTALAADDEQDAWRLGARLEQGRDSGRQTLWRLYATRAWLGQDSDEFRERAEPPVRQQRHFELSQRTAGAGVDGRLSFTGWNQMQVFGYGAELAAGRIAEGRDALQTNLDDGTQTDVLLGESFPRRDFPVTDTLELGAYLNGELGVPGTGLRLLPGLRYDDFRLDSRSDRRFSEGSPRVEVTDLHNRAWTPRLGVLVPFTDALRGFAQYARGFRAPPAYDVNLGIDIVAFNARALPNPDLKPERSDAFELGLRHRGALAQVELSLFETHYEDFIASNAFVGTDPDTGTRLFQSRNIDRATIRGVELRWRQDLAVLGASRWTAEMAGAWLRGENRDTDEPLSTIDPARLILALDRETDLTALRLRLTAVDAQQRVDGSAGPRFNAPGYAVLDLIGEVRPYRTWTVRLGVFNALDHRYWDWSDVYGRSVDDPQLPLLARSGRYASASVHFSF